MIPSDNRLTVSPLMYVPLLDESSSTTIIRPSLSNLRIILQCFPDSQGSCTCMSLSATRPIVKTSLRISTLFTLRVMLLSFAQTSLGRASEASAFFSGSTIFPFPPSASLPY